MRLGAARQRRLAALALLAGLLSAPRVCGAAEAARPRLAVVIDDFGLTYRPNVKDEAWMKLPWKATYAVMPASPRTREAAIATLKAGKELIIHFPFDPFLSLELPPGDEASTADLEKARALLRRCLSTIPGAKGLNNHRSTKATRSRALMRRFMEDLKAAGLYFLDSRVSAKSVAYEEAKRAGLKAAANDVFLDEARRHDKAFCERMLARAASLARKTGSAVAIGHHYFHGTYECLAEGVPRLQKAGFEFVFASDLVR